MAESIGNPSCLLYGPGVAKFENRPYPVIEDQNDVIIRIAYVGVCGSDVHFWTHGGMRAKVDAAHPLVMGHEASGTIVEIGSGVRTLKPGDRVAIEPGYPCRRCNFCKSGKYNFCTGMRFAASPPDNHGTLTKFFKLPEDFCYKLPPSTELDAGVLVEPLAVAAHVTRLADVKVGMNVVVFGAGTIGLLCSAVAKAMGAAKVISVDINQARLDFAQSYASTGTYLSTRDKAADDIASEIKEEFTLGGGADVVLEATGTESCIEAGVYLLRLGGTFIQAGLGKPKIQFPIVELSEKEITMKGSFRYNAGDYELAIHLLESKKVSVKELITGIVPFERVTDAWESTKNGIGIKNLIRGPQD